MARSVTLLNHKGGVGKTMVTILTAEALAAEGDSVLVVDMDPQANATRRLGIPGDALPYTDTLVQCLDMEKGPVQVGGAVAYVALSQWPNDASKMIHVLPSHHLLGVRGADAGKTGSIRRLQKALRGVSERYDWTLVDTPPSLEHLTQMALTATDDALIVATPEHDAVEGAVRAKDFIEMYGEDMDGVNILGVIANGVRARTTLHESYLNVLAEQFPGQVWEPSIPQRVELGTSMSYAAPPSSGNQEVWEMGRLLAKNLKGTRA